LKLSFSNCSFARIFGVCVLVLLTAPFVVAQQPASPAKPEAAATKPAADEPPFKLTVKKSPIISIGLKAEKAKLTEIAADLARRLKTHVLVGPTLQNEVVSIEFRDLTLEPAMQLMAPAVYIDYEVDTGSGDPGKPLGIYFYGANQGEPPLTAVVPSSTQSLLIEGDTEDGVEPTTEEAKKKLEEQPLRVQFANNNLSVKAKKQPLALVLLKIGEELGIPVEIQFESNDIVDTEITKQSVEDTIRKLSPNIKLFLRANLTHAERRVLRIVLTDPSKTAQQGL
jgi:hypothetical protein